MTDFNWHHIVKRHPEIASHKEKIIENLEKPDKVTDSLKDDKTKYYYKNKKEKARYLQVVVKYLNNHGFVLTAYFVRHM